MGNIGTQLDRFQGDKDKVTYVAPVLPGADIITVIVYDNKGRKDRDFPTVAIVEGGKR